MFTRHQLTCRRAGCGRAFTATRSDARFCSRRCRRDKSIPAVPGRCDQRRDAASRDQPGQRVLGHRMSPNQSTRTTVGVAG